MKQRQAKQTVWRTLALSLALCGQSQWAHAAIAQSPLFLASQPRPNIMFTLDDSGSMDWNFIPDSTAVMSGNTLIDHLDPNNWGGSFLAVNLRMWNAAYNGMAYDPNVLYKPWVKADRTYMPDSNPSAARLHPLETGVVNLIDRSDGGKRYMAFYANRVNNKYEKVVIEPGNEAKFGPKGADRSDCAGAVCTYDEEIKNFANWYTYYRKRIYTAIAGTSQAFADLEGNQRVGYGQINSSGNKVDGVDANTVMLPVRDFSGVARTNFYNSLFAARPGGGTPLRRAMDDVGKYFSRAKNNGSPWAEEPDKPNSTELSCRRTYHILMTDGYWNGDAATTSGTSEADNTDGEEYTHAQTGVKYKYVASKAGPYYRSEASNTLADVAMYYWKKDLRSDLANNVPSTSTDEAFWQHITQYTVGLGVNGTLTFPTDTAALKAGVNKFWPNPVNQNTPTAVDDLWHAAVNGHGLYFSARNPKSFRDGLIAALEDISKAQAAASTVALNFSSTMSGDGLAFVPGFESGSWAGSLKARRVVDGAVTAQVAWQAENLIPAWSARNILTWDRAQAKAVPFQWANLSADQKTALGNSSDVLEYLRGNNAKERSQNGTFRNRPHKLGDIVNSSPAYVKDANFAYQNMGGYRTFQASKQTRTPMVYVGANDGMLHAFNANTGVEAFAYVPNAVYPNLKKLTETNYAHRYFVDGQLVEADAFKANDGWRTLLLGSTGAGAKALFALDVTAPANASGANQLGASNVLWEKSNADISDLGHVLGKSTVAKMRNGAWGVIVGNGYESANNRAVLYVLNAFTGETIAKLDTGNKGTPNGLSTPAILYNEDREAVAAYAGDLQGNLWKFDLSDASASNWKVAFEGEPLFTAKNDNNEIQPITLRPALGYHPKGGYMVNFATGKYFDTEDGSSTSRQSAYGIWDKSGIKDVASTRIIGSRSTILKGHKLVADAASGGVAVKDVARNGDLTEVGEIDWATVRGWYADLNQGAGERGIGEPFITDDTTFWLTTLDPVADPCASGGDSRLYGFNFLNGGGNPDAVMDTNGDGVINQSDRAGVIGKKTGGTVAASGVFKKVDPPPCGKPGQPACQCGGAGQAPCPSPSCQSTTRKLVINRMDGTTQEMNVRPYCRPPLRSWREVNIGY
ncbi:PilC/PilY family type IV pilus protein [Massilia sp. W12]|uniref:pilus assembly protein n=1 Tax=Massilia sp. W12 TaxID=3126507 RepID=UPI0030CAD6F8